MTQQKIHFSRSHPLFPRKITDNNGFTLIEMVVVMVIVGIIISILVTVLPSLIQSSKIKKTQALLEKADYALQGYSIANYRLPYADSGTDGDEDTGVYVGNLPYRTLGLSSGNDVWGNSIKYGVCEDLTTTTSSTFCTTLTGITTPYNDAAKIHTTDQSTAQITNQAYIIVSGGLRDLDGDTVDGLFDGFNEGSDVQFDDPTKIEFHGSPTSSRYDDLMGAFSLNELIQKNCTGGAGGSGGSGGEDTYTNGCTNGTDDDADGYTDCDDQDCYGVGGCGAGGPDVEITTTTIPSGPVNSTYSATFQATGGITPYEWTLTDNGGFTDFSLHTYTAQLSGTLDQCPGTYTIGVQVVDSTLPADGGPKTDSETFDLQVTSNLAVSRTSGAGTDITWDSPSQQETFEATGGHLGNIDWTLDTGGATGFIVTSTGSDTCTIEKNGTSTEGTYTFTLTATDASCAGNAADIVLTVTVTASGTGSPSATGNINGVIDTLEFDTSSGYEPDMTHVDGDVYAIAYRGPGDDGFLKTVEIATDGQITNTVIDTLEFDTSSGFDPSIIHINADVYAIAYRGPNSDGFLKTVEIATDGQITNAVIDTLEFDTSSGSEPAIIHVNGDVYAIAYRGPNLDGFLKTAEIATDGQITDTVIDTLEFDTSNSFEPDIIHVNADVYAIAYRGTWQDDGFLKTVEIATDGQITNTVIDTLEFDTSSGFEPKIIQVGGDVYAIAYRGPNSDGFLKTVEIATDGQITDTVIDTLEFDTSDGFEPDIIHVSGDFYAIAYRGINNDGFLKTVEIN
jgi:prepilin-type N-terminal cleavage/methylation domain-containing protein